VVESVVLRPFSCRVERLVLSFSLKEENIASLFVNREGDGGRTGKMEMES
jgi:hypothetical protein